MFSGQVRSSQKDEEQYDPRKRDPQFAYAGTSLLYELVRIDLLYEGSSLNDTIHSCLSLTITILRFPCMPDSFSRLHHSPQVLICRSTRYLISLIDLFTRTPRSLARKVPVRCSLQLAKSMEQAGLLSSGEKRLIPSDL